PASGSAGPGRPHHAARDDPAHRLARAGGSRRASGGPRRHPRHAHLRPPGGAAGARRLANLDARDARTTLQRAQRPGLEHAAARGRDPGAAHPGDEHDGRCRMSGTPQGSVWRQPAQVWAVAFACVVAFMGIGLVDPILPAIADSLKASPVETELLFTSYLLVTGLAMLVTSWISSRIGAKATLLVGLGLIVVFALLCALSGSVDWVIG